MTIINNLEMLSFPDRDSWLSRPLTRVVARSLTTVQKAERRKAQWRYRRARRNEEAESFHVAEHDATWLTPSATLDPRRDWIDVRSPGWAR
jgi:hypothetical protein